MVERELVTLHLDGVGTQSGEVGHAQHIEFFALIQLYPKHGDPIKLAGKHWELFHVLEIEGHGHHAVHGHLSQVESVSHLQVLEAVDDGFLLWDTYLFIWI